MNYVNKSINFFLEELKGKKPVPGGGSVVALTGAMACGLLSMVCAFSRSSKDIETSKALEAIEKKSAIHLNKLKKLMQEDIENYEIFSAAVKDKSKSRWKSEKAIRKILNPPLAVLRLMPPLMEYSESLTKIAKLNIVSDVSVAASLVLACFEGASVSVKINLKSLKDENLTASLMKEMDDAGIKLRKQKENILKEVDERLGMKSHKSTVTRHK